MIATEDCEYCQAAHGSYEIVARSLCWFEKNTCCQMDSVGGSCYACDNSEEDVSGED